MYLLDSRNHFGPALSTAWDQNRLRQYLDLFRDLSAPALGGSHWLSLCSQFCLWFAVLPVSEIRECLTKGRPMWAQNCLRWLSVLEGRKTSNGTARVSSRVGRKRSCILSNMSQFQLPSCDAWSLWLRSGRAGACRWSAIFLANSCREMERWEPRRERQRRRWDPVHQWYCGHRYIQSIDL